MMVRGAEEINKKKKIIILLNENKYNFRKQQKVVFNKVDLSIKEQCLYLKTNTENNSQTKYSMVGPTNFWI
jgi:hypothetical protein